MIDESSLLPDVYQNECGYLSTPADMDLIKRLTEFDEWVQEHSVTGWDEYSVTGTDVYPYFLTLLIRAGIAFAWTYESTEDFAYFAYNFPTEDKPQNYEIFRTGKRKGFARMSKKLRKQIESTSAANELLYTMGIKNGSN